MPQSLSRILVHLVFSTKHRQPFLESKTHASLFPYMRGTLKNLDAPLLEIGGHIDHVHLLFGLPRTLSIAQVTEKVKTASTKWAKEEWPDQRDFGWQHGYGAFSVGSAEVERITRYIRGQEEHHRSTSFQDEFRALLRESGVPFDERYMWD